MKLNSYLKKHKNEVRTLNVFDIDDTLFDTEAKVGVIKDGKRIKNLAPGEYNTYILKTGEKLDFGQFRSGKFFRETSKPIKNVLNLAKRLVKTNDENSKTIIITARSDMEQKEDFLQKFRDHGFPVDKVYIERAGNLKYKNTARNKSIIIARYLKDKKYDAVHMWDDSSDNLDSLLRMSSLFPDVEFVGHLVKNGTIVDYARQEQRKRNLGETIKTIAIQSYNQRKYVLE